MSEGFELTRGIMRVFPEKFLRFSKKFLHKMPKMA